MQFWEKGPDLPIAMDYGCAVSISSSAFLIISKREVREFDAAFDSGNPTSNSNWMDSATWPQLQTERWYHPGCAVIGKTLVVAGGFRSPVSTAFSAGSINSTAGSINSTGSGGATGSMGSWRSMGSEMDYLYADSGSGSGSGSGSEFSRILPSAPSTSNLASLDWCSTRCNVYHFPECCSNPICFTRRRSDCQSTLQWTDNMRHGETAVFYFHWQTSFVSEYKLSSKLLLCPILTINSQSLEDA